MLIVLTMLESALELSHDHVCLGICIVFGTPWWKVVREELSLELQAELKLIPRTYSISSTSTHHNDIILAYTFSKNCVLSMYVMMSLLWETKIPMHLRPLIRDSVMPLIPLINWRPSTTTPWIIVTIPIVLLKMDVSTYHMALVSRVVIFFLFYPIHLVFCQHTFDYFCCTWMDLKK